MVAALKWHEVLPDVPPLTLGPELTQTMLRDPRHLAFTLARYKFAAKMLEGKAHVFEVGCGEGLGTYLVAQAVGRVVAIDSHQAHVDGCLERYAGREAEQCVAFGRHDITRGPIPWQSGRYDAGYALDVIEHIFPAETERFFRNITASLTDEGVFILGTPSLESQRYASDASRSEHINCRSGDDWRLVCEEYFRHVFLFGMNDEVLHTGFLPMAHYVLALCVGPKR